MEKEPKEDEEFDEDEMEEQVEQKDKKRNLPGIIKILNNIESKLEGVEENELGLPHGHPMIKEIEKIQDQKELIRINREKFAEKHKDKKKKREDEKEREEHKRKAQEKVADINKKLLDLVNSGEKFVEEMNEFLPEVSSYPSVKAKLVRLIRLIRSFSMGIGQYAIRPSLEFFYHRED